MKYLFKILLLTFALLERVYLTSSDINLTSSHVWGPGLSPEKIVMPARYFFIKLTDIKINKSDTSLINNLQVLIDGGTKKQKPCRIWTNIFDKKDGSYIVRYKLYETCLNIKISITYEGSHLAESPYIINKPILPDDCNCPIQKIEEVLNSWACGPAPQFLKSRLSEFGQINWVERRKHVIKKFDQPHSVSLCHYIIKNNKIHRRCYGKYVGFNMFVDNILLSLTRKVVLPDIEFFANLGDWPLSTYNLKERYPIFSWCGSTESYDIIMPTYDITESSLESMGRVTLDIMSVQGNTEGTWESRIPKLFWRGRDSNKYRLELIKMSREYPDLFNASLTNFFFYRDEEAIYGPKTEHVSFFKFFDIASKNSALWKMSNFLLTLETRNGFLYKYQLAIDGTVAPYRMPYLLAGGSLVFKPESKYFEYFYKDLEPNVHYIPVKEDITDLVDKIKWAIENDSKAKKIAQQAQQFVNENLLPKDIFCYHFHIFNEFSKIITSRIEVLKEMDIIEQKKTEKCECKQYKDEL